MEPSAAVDSTRRVAGSAGDGTAVVAIWNDIRPEGRAEFFEWHNREHMAERVGIRGFLRGRRFVAIEGRPEFFTLYDSEGPQVLSGPDYQERLNNPTPWTRRAITAFLNTSRSLCTVTCSAGAGEGGLMVTLRYEVAAGREAEMTAALAGRILPALAIRPGVVRVRLCVADHDASGVQSAEKKNIERARVPGWIVLVEGGADAAALNAACDVLLSSTTLAGAGATGAVERGLYQLQYACFPAGAAAAR